MTRMPPSSGGPSVSPAALPLEPPERLSGHHDVTSFAAGPEDLGGQGEWLKHSALANDRDGTTRTFVACFSGTRRVAAFYGLAAASIVRADLPRALRPHGTPAAVPAILIARLAVHQDLQGQGLGKSVLVSALDRCLTILDHVAFRVIVVDAAGLRARRLYERFEFRAVASDDLPNRLVLPIGMAIKLLRPAGAGE